MKFYQIADIDEGSMFFSSKGKALKWIRKNWSKEERLEAFYYINIVRKIDKDRLCRMLSGMGWADKCIECDWQFRPRNRR